MEEQMPFVNLEECKMLIIQQKQSCENNTEINDK